MVTLEVLVLLSFSIVNLLSYFYAMYILASWESCVALRLYLK